MAHHNLLLKAFMALWAYSVVSPKRNVWLFLLHEINAMSKHSFLLRIQKHFHFLSHDLLRCLLWARRLASDKHFKITFLANNARGISKMYLCYDASPGQLQEEETPKSSQKCFILDWQRRQQVDGWLRKKRDWYFTIIKFIKRQSWTDERLDFGKTNPRMRWAKKRASGRNPSGWRCQKATTLCFTSIKSSINKTSLLQPFYRRANNSPALFTSSGDTLRRGSGSLRAKVLIASRPPHQRVDLLLCAKQISLVETHSSCARFRFFFIVGVQWNGMTPCDKGLGDISQVLFHAPSRHRRKRWNWFAEGHDDSTRERAAMLGQRSFLIANSNKRRLTSALLRAAACEWTLSDQQPRTEAFELI